VELLTVKLNSALAVATKNPSAGQAIVFDLSTLGVAVLIVLIVMVLAVCE